jgi:ABC-type transport system involved in multi-copper enzyme maturation permease subunit
MLSVIQITLKGIFRDRTFQGIMALAVLFLLIPSAASLSMRQVTELSITLSLSLISFILLLLSIFLGATAIWKDMERRYILSVISLPVSRSTYLVGRFFGVALFILLTALFLGTVSLFVIKVCSGIYPPSRPLVWSTIAVTIFFDALKYIIIVAVAMLLGTVSTSFFLPVFGTVSAFLAGTITQQVYDYLQTPSAQKAVSAVVKDMAQALYYLLPNLSSFDLKVNAIYAIPLNPSGVLLTVLYFVVYSGCLLAIGAILFERRELK